METGIAAWQPAAELLSRGAALSFTRCGPFDSAFETERWKARLKMWVRLLALPMTVNVQDTITSCLWSNKFVKWKADAQSIAVKAACKRAGQLQRPTVYGLSGVWVNHLGGWVFYICVSHLGWVRDTHTPKTVHY